MNGGGHHPPVLAEFKGSLQESGIPAVRKPGLHRYLSLSFPIGLEDVNRGADVKANFQLLKGHPWEGGGAAGVTALRGLGKGRGLDSRRIRAGMGTICECSTGHQSLLITGNADFGLKNPGSWVY